MKNIRKGLFIAIALFIVSCSKEEIKDREKPTIDLTNGFPTNCSVIKKGEPFTFKATFNDNVALGSYSIDVHNNFDHHTHSTEEETCDLLPKKKPVKPFKLIKTYAIEGNPKAYRATKEFTVGKEYDSGDYHFMIKVTDKEGWTTLKGISIKIE